MPLEKGREEERPAFNVNLRLIEGVNQMTIKYALYENKLTEAADLYAAKVLISGSADLQTVADRIVEQGSTVTRTDVIAVLEGAIMATESLLLEGARINFGGLCDLYPKIKGKFNGITDHYDPSRHQIDVGASPGARVRNTVRDNATVTKQDTILPVPLVLEFIDLASGSINTDLTPGNIGTINGSRLAFSEQASDEGLCFQNTSTAESVRVTAIQKNKPSELVFMIPELTAGTYQVEVHKRFTPEGQLRTGRLDNILTVVAAMAAVS